MATKSAFSKTVMDDVTSVLMNLYYVIYEKSEKRELTDIPILKESIWKPEKAHGTRWLQHKSRASKFLIISYTIIMCPYRVYGIGRISY